MRYQLNSKLLLDEVTCRKFSEQCGGEGRKREGEIKKHALMREKDRSLCTSKRLVVVVVVVVVRLGIKFATGSTHVSAGVCRTLLRLLKGVRTLVFLAQAIDAEENEQDQQQ